MTSTSNRISRLIDERKEQILYQWRARVRLLPAAHHLSVPVLNDHLGDLLTGLALALREATSESLLEAGETPAYRQNPVAHGLERLRIGFDLEEVVAEYNALRAGIYELAESEGLDMRGAPGQTLNRVIDAAIGLAVKTYADQQAHQVQERRAQHLAFVVHDLRAPLATLSLASGLLRRELSEPDEAVTELLGVMRDSLHRMDTLIQRVLDEDAAIRAEDQQQLGSEWIPLKELVETLYAELRLVSEKTGVRLEHELDEALVVFADADRLRLILQNLVSNAIRYTRQGTVTVLAERVEGGVLCRVRDDGMGIAPDRLAAIFRPGESDSQASGGFGLGLAIVHKLVQAHRGRVSVESEPGRGTTFSLFFPTPDEPGV